MDHLKEIIDSLDSAEKREFRHFIQRNKQRGNRKDLALFDLYSSSPIPSVDEQMRVLSIPNKNAYYSNRKRLYAHLSDYALLKANEEDGTAGSRVRGLYNVALHLFERGLDILAWNLINKAEELGRKNSLYSELNDIYLLQVDKIHLQNNHSLFDIVRAYEANRERLVQMEKLFLFKAELRHNMIQASRSGMEVDLRQILHRIIAQNALNTDVTQDPRLLVTVLRTIRDSAMQVKQYVAFEQLAETLYAGLMDKGHPDRNVDICYMIAHAKYRNKRFAQAQTFIKTSREELHKCTKTYQRKMNLRLTLLDAANTLFLGDVTLAIDQLEMLLAQKLTGVQESNAILNLSVYHFYGQSYKEAQRSMLRLRHTDSWYEDKMGPEWLLKQKMIELLIYQELGEIDLVESRLRSIQRSYKNLLAKAKYQRASAFLKLIKTYSTRLEEISPSELSQQISISWDWLPKEQEDLQAMMFYAWLKSKIISAPCYDVLLDLVGVRSLPEDGALIS